MGQVILQSLEGIFTITFMVVLGMVLNKKGWFDDKSSALLARLVTTISLPLYIITGFSKNFTVDSLRALAPDMWLPFLSIMAAMGVGLLLVKLGKVKQGRRGILTTNAFIANTVFIGLPVNLALFGDKSIPPVMLYYMVNTSIFWTLGIYFILADVTGHKSGIFSLSGLKKLLSPPLVSFGIGLVMILLDVHLPKFLAAPFQYVGNLTTPLSLIFIGIEVSKLSLRELQLDKDMWLGILGRFCVCPVCVLLLAPLLGVSGLSLKVFTMQAAMPAMTQIAIMSKFYGADSEFAAKLSFVTILLGIITIPVYMTITALL